jgi:hypothetical protein
MQADEAWPHYAAAVELTALAMFMLASTDPGRGVPVSCLTLVSIIHFASFMFFFDFFNTDFYQRRNIAGVKALSSEMDLAESGIY